MNIEESQAEASRILAEAGWIADPGWGGFTYGTCVGGLAPDGNVYVKNWAAIPPGHPKYGPDTPDEPHEAAAWLAARYVNPLSLASVGEAVQPVEHETHGETGEAPILEEAADDGGDSPSSELEPEVLRPKFSGLGGGGDEGSRATASPPSQDLGGDGGDVHADPSPAELEAIAETGALFDDTEATGLSAVVARDMGSDDADRASESAQGPVSTDPIDATFWSEALEAPDLGADIVAAEEEAGGSQFIFGDNLDQMRTAAIGLTMRYAKSIMPFWTTDHDAELRELRNFTMGVAEKRFNPDPVRDERLQELEAISRHITQIEAARDEKVEFLEAASREQVEAFVVEDGWPG